MIAQQQHGLALCAGQDARAFFSVHGDAFKVVIGDLSVQLRSVKVAVGQAVFQAAHGHGGRGVNVHDAMRVGQCLVNGAVEGETRGVDGPVRAANDLARTVHLHQIGSTHFRVMQTKRVDEKVCVFTRHTQRDVVVDQLGPAQVVEYTIRSGELHTGFPFIGAKAGRAGIGRGHVLA